MFYSAFVGAGTHSRVAERREFVVIWSKDFPCFMSRPTENDDHECAHQKCGIRLFGVVETGVVVNFVGAVLLVVDELLQFFTK
jgi:hypothetical protein